MKIKNLSIILFLAWVISGTSMVRAENSLSQQVVDLILDDKPIPEDLLLQATHELENPVKKYDQALQMFLNIPFEQRQYVFPAIFESDFIPQKIRTHPEIAIWKGKMPTVIDPHMQDFADKYLTDLNPRFYSFLIPRSLPTRQPDSMLEGNINWATIMKNMNSLPPQDKAPFTAYGSVENYLPIPRHIQQNYRSTSLTQSDIEKLGTGLYTLNYFIKMQPDRQRLMQRLELLTLFYSDRNNEQINPIQNQIERLRLLKKGKALDTLFQKMGFKDADEFAQKADAIAKAYRVHDLSLNMAFFYQKIRGVPKETLSESEQVVWVQAKQHEAPPGDVYFVEPYLSDIYSAFQKAGYQTLLNPLKIDE